MHLSFTCPSWVSSLRVGKHVAELRISLYNTIGLFHCLPGNKRCNSNWPSTVKSSGQSPRRPPLPLKGLESSALQALSTASCLSPMYYRHFLFSSEVHLIAMLVMDELSLQQRILPARLCLCNSDLGSEDMILKWVSQGWSTEKWYRSPTTYERCGDNYPERLSNFDLEDKWH
jgi:hypothetical protein